MKEEDKDLNYWKENAKDAYMTTPICVLRYITELEKEVKNNAVLPPAVSDTLPHQVIAWLGQYRDKLPQEAINSLQNMCGY